jgi:hypothetical protein
MIEGPQSASRSLWSVAKQHRGSVRSILAVAGGNSTAAILGGIGGILAARFIPPETAGSFRAYAIPLMYLTFLHLGTFDGLNRQIPLHLGQGRGDLAEEEAAAAAAWNLLLSVVVSIGFLVAAALALVLGDYRGALGWTVQAIAAWAVFYGGYLGTTYRTLDHFVGLSRIQALQSVLSFLLVFTLPTLGFFGLCIRAAVPSVAGTLLLHRVRPLRVEPLRARKPLLALIRIGLPFCFWGTLYTSLWVAAESTLLLALGGAKGLGLFAVAVVLREGICILPQAINQVLTPRILERYGRDGKLSSASALAYKLVPPLVLGMTVIVLTLSFALDALVPILIPKYVEGLALMKASLWIGVIQAAGLPLNALIASGKSWSYGRGIVAGGLAFLLAAYALYPCVGGLLAVAVGSLIGRTVRTAFGYLDLRRLGQREAE